MNTMLPNLLPNSALNLLPNAPPNANNRFIAMPFLLLLLTLLLAFPILLFAADQNIELIELKHRDVNDVIPVIKPLLGENDRVSGTGNQLILKSSAETIAQIKNILHKIDSPVRRLKITVKYASEAQQSQDTANVSGNVTLLKNNEDNKTNTQANISTRITTTRSDEDRYSTQQIQVSEGHWADVNIGQLIPVTQSKLRVSGINTTLQTGTEYKKTGAGFRVLPTIRNNSVILKIAPHYSKRNTIDNRKIDSLSAQTEITGQLGKWIDIGGTSTTVNHNPTEKVYSTKKQFADNRRIWVKVDMISNE